MLDNVARCFVAIAMAMLAACASQPGLTPDDLSGLSLTNPQLPESKVMTGGQPTTEDLELLRARGVTTVVSLRSEAEEVDFDEAAKAEELGMSFIRIPVSTSQGLDPATAQYLRQRLDAASGPVFLHCGSGNRVGGMYAINAYANEGKALEEALAIGRAAGMTRFEPTIREVLEGLAQ
jgi:uncharacterized protein (TIGR01244 family)